MDALRRRRRIGWATLAAALAAAGALLLPASADATIVRLGAVAEEPSECIEPRARTASTHCQLFAGSPLTVVGLADDEDGMTRLAPQPFTLLEVARGRAARPVVSWTTLDENDADDKPVVRPSRSTDYQLRFNGNDALPPGDSSTMIVGVGVRITIPEGSRSGGNRVRVPVTVNLPSRAARGRLELRRCKDSKGFTARSCAGRRSYDVVARSSVRRAGVRTFAIVMPPRTLRRYEVAYRPATRGHAVTRQAFSVLRGFDGRTTYRYTVRRAPFGNR